MFNNTLAFYKLGGQIKNLAPIFEKFDKVEILDSKIILHFRESLSETEKKNLDAFMCFVNEQIGEYLPKGDEND